MQGWRKRMEDAHISDIGVGPNNQFHVFGVFDGHGGKEVSQYVKKHYTTEFLNLQNFKSGNIKGSLTESFLKIDDLLVEPEGKIELKKYAKMSKEEVEKRDAKEKK